MIVSLDDTRVTYNPIYNSGVSEPRAGEFSKIFNNLRNRYDYDETIDFGLIAVSIDTEQTIPFAASKTLTTTKAMYSKQDIITAIDEESLTFSLTLVPVLDPQNTMIPVAWTNEMWDMLYRALDTRDYKPMIFGNPNRRLFSAASVDSDDVSDYVSRPYYNCIAMIGSVSELKMFGNSEGYVTIPFVCDAPHMWIDVQKTYERYSEEQEAGGWYFPNYSNVKDYTGQAMVYPIITVYDFISSEFSGDTPQGYISFANASNSEIPWFRMTGFIADDTLAKIVIDNYNKQIYGFDKINNVEVLNDTNYIACLSPIRFFQLPEESSHRTPTNLIGGRQVYHRTYMCDDTTSLYKIQFFYSCPYIGGNEDGILPSLEEDNHSVMLHDENEGG